MYDRQTVSQRDEQKKIEIKRKTDKQIERQKNKETKSEEKRYRGNKDKRI